MAFKKGNLYTNEAKTEGIYPNTVYSAIFKDDMSKTLAADLGDLSHYNAQTITSGVDPLYLHLEMDLLWENASHTSTFAAQTIQLDLSGYSLILVFFKRSTTDNSYGSNINKIGIGSLCTCGASSTNLTSTLSRKYTSSSSGITFTTGFNSNGGNANDDYMIPYQIYGIK